MAQGHSIGSSLVEEDKFGFATSLLEKAKSKGVSLLLPTDVVIADKLAAYANCKIVPAYDISHGWMGFDIGPDSIETFSHCPSINRLCPAPFKVDSALYSVDIWYLTCLLLGARISCDSELESSSKGATSGKLTASARAEKSAWEGISCDSELESSSKGATLGELTVDAHAEKSAWEA